MSDIKMTVDKSKLPPGKPMPYDTTLNIYQRLRKVRQVVTYIQKHDTGQGYSGIRHDELIDKVRDQFIEHGLDWSLRTMEPLPGGEWITLTSRDGYEYRMRYQQYQCTFVLVNIDVPNEQIVVSSVGEGYDRSDKGVGKAATYAEKTALAKLLNIRTGEDPDFVVSDPNGKIDEPDPERAKLVSTILDLARGRTDDPQAEINRVLVNMREMYTSARRLRSIHEVPIEQLRQWAEHWKSEDTAPPPAEQEEQTPPEPKPKKKKTRKKKAGPDQDLVDIVKGKFPDMNVDDDTAAKGALAMLMYYNATWESMKDPEVKTIMLQRARKLTPEAWNEFVLRSMGRA